MIRAGSEQRYERWRQSWLRGGRSQALNVMMHHGLRTTLIMTAPKASPSRPVPSANLRPQRFDVEMSEPALSAAAHWVRSLLNDESNPIRLSETR